MIYLSSFDFPAREREYDFTMSQEVFFCVVYPGDPVPEKEVLRSMAEVVLLEGIRLREVPKGVYLLNAAPLKLAGADGAPCRAVLVDRER